MKSMSNLFAFSIALLLHLIFPAGSLFIQHESVKRRSALLPIRSQLSFPSPTVACGARFLERCFVYTSRHGLNSFNVNSRTMSIVVLCFLFTLNENFWYGAILLYSRLSFLTCFLVISYLIVWNKFIQSY